MKDIEKNNEAFKALSLVSRRIAELEVEDDWLKAENAKMRNVRSENTSLRGAAQGLGELCDKYKAENAKLRELVRLMVRRHTPISPCKDIPCGECPVKDECDQEDALMRELGVEVD